VRQLEVRAFEKVRNAVTRRAVSSPPALALASLILIVIIRNQLGDTLIFAFASCLDEIWRSCVCVAPNAGGTIVKQPQPINRNLVF